MDDFVNNPIIQQVFFFLLGVLVTAIFHLLSIKRKPKPEWGIYSSSPVLKDNGNINKHLKIIYKDIQLDKLTVTTLYLLNRGKVSLRKDDVAETIKFIFEEDVDIIDIVDVKKSISSIDVTQKVYNSTEENRTSCIEMNFKYLNHNDGVMFTVLHTGKDSKGIHVEGELIDARLYRIKLSKFFGVLIAAALIGISVSIIVNMAISGLAQANLMGKALLLILLLCLLSLYVAAKTNKEMALPYWITKKRKIKYILEMLGFSK